MPFVTLISAAEYFMLNDLRKWISKTYFNGKPAATAKSILWINRYRHAIDLTYYTMYLTTSSKEFGLPYSDLKSWNENSGWNDAYRKLLKYLRRSRDSKRCREKWCVTRNCEYCDKGVTIDCRNYKDNRGNYNFYALYLTCEVCQRLNRYILRPRVEGCRCINHCTYHVTPGEQDNRRKADKTFVMGNRCPIHK
jgi:hypothetical protein